MQGAEGRPQRGGHGVDPVTNDVVIAILHDEEQHRRLFEGYLREFEDVERAVGG